LVFAEAQVEEGSRKIWTSIRGAGKLLIVYGSIRAGLDHLVVDGRRAAEFVNGQVIQASAAIIERSGKNDELACPEDSIVSSRT